MTDKPKILIVDDEPEIRSMLRVLLEVEDFQVIETDTGKGALRQIVAASPSLILLDLGLPDIDGQDIIASIRQFSQTPIIVLTARSEDYQAIRALNAGVDDYVTKPFRMDVLLARIRANLRPVDTRSANGDLTNGPIRIDRIRHEVFVNQRRVNFTPKEFALLELFLKNKGRIITHRQILGEVWGDSHLNDPQYLRVYIGQVRAKLDKAGGLGGCLTSEARIGYRLAVLEADAAAVAAE
ncbi:MAG: response regulator transcription factor [Asticcacaulis sp.]|uniref:response regulator transcription factor n=1 Tax=Asticcacaulis sp. TaxID=1872648 RepID=UPI0039E521AE